MDVGAGEGIREIWQRRRRRRRRRSGFVYSLKVLPARHPPTHPADPGLHYTRHDRETRSRSSGAATPDLSEVA